MLLLIIHLSKFITKFHFWVELSSSDCIYLRFPFYLFRLCSDTFIICRHVANGEILSVSLLLEDVLSTGVQERALKRAIRDTEESEDADTEGKYDILSLRKNPTELEELSNR